MADDEFRARRITNLRDLQDELGERAGLIEWWLGLDGDLLVEVLPQPDPGDDDEFTSSDIRINIIFVDDPDRARYWFDVSRTWFEGLFPLGSLVDPPSDVSSLDDLVPLVASADALGNTPSSDRPDPDVVEYYSGLAERLALAWSRGPASIRSTRNLIFSVIPVIPMNYSWKIVLALKALLIVEDPDQFVVLPRGGGPNERETSDDWALRTLASICDELVDVLSRLAR